MHRLSFSILLSAIFSLGWTQTLVIHTTDTAPIQFPIAEVDSITISTTPFVSYTADPLWQIFGIIPETATTAPAGILMTAPEGLKIYGLSNRTIIARYKVNPTNQSQEITIYLRWKIAVEPGTDVRIMFELWPDTILNHETYPLVDLSLDATKETTGVNSEDVWYYSLIKINPYQAKMITCTNNYVHCRGNIIQTVSTPLAKPITTFALRLTASPATYFLISEIKEE